MESYYREVKDHAKAKLIMARVCLRVNKSCSSKMVSQQNLPQISLPSHGIKYPSKKIKQTSNV